MVSHCNGNNNETKLKEPSVPLCTAEEEKLAGGPGDRKGWSRRQVEKVVETPLAIDTGKENGNTEAEH